jgi:hypothetical protein
MVAGKRTVFSPPGSLYQSFFKRARQQNSESSGDSRENPAILKSDDSKIQYCRLGYNFMVIFVRICPTLEVVRIFNGKCCIRLTEKLAKFRKFLKNQ